MALPVRSEMKEDVLPLQRALRALEDAKQALKKFQATASVQKDKDLAEEVEELRRKVKKTRKLGESVANRWFDGSTF